MVHLRGIDTVRVYMFIFEILGYHKATVLPIQKQHEGV